MGNQVWSRQLDVKHLDDAHVVEHESKGIWNPSRLAAKQRWPSIMRVSGAVDPLYDGGPSRDFFVAGTTAAPALL